MAPPNGLFRISSYVVFVIVVHSVQNIAIHRIRLIFDSSNTLVYRLGPTTDTHFSQYLSDSTNVKNSLFLNPVTEDEIVRLVAQLKPKKSKGHDELDMCLIKKLIPYCCTIETYI